MMTDSIVVKRLIRSLQYRLTYIRVFEVFLEPDLHPAIVRLLGSLIEVQQIAVVTLSNYLQGMSVDTQSLPLNQKLMDQAAQRPSTSSRLRFIRYGLKRSVSWYKMQLVDRQMTADPVLKQILFELGEREAAGLWHTEAVMVMLRIRLEPWSRDRQAPPRQTLVQEIDRYSCRIGSTKRPVWSGR